MAKTSSKVLSVRARVDDCRESQPGSSIQAKCPAFPAGAGPFQDTPPETAPHEPGLGPTQPCANSSTPPPQTVADSSPLGCLKPPKDAGKSIQQAFAGEDSTPGGSARDTYGNSAAHWAALAGHHQLLESLGRELLLLTNGQGATPLHAAAYGGHLNAVQVLLKSAGAAASMADHNGQTPLHFAVICGLPAIISALLNAGSPVNHVNKNGETALILALNRGADAGVVHELLAAGADWCFRVLYAAQHGQALVIEEELAASAARQVESNEPRLHDVEKGMNSQIMARSISNNSAPSTNPALELGVDPGKGRAGPHVVPMESKIVHIKDQDGWTPLLKAARYGHRAAIEVLLKGGSNFDEQLKETRETPLLLAARHGHHEAVEALVACGASLELADINLERTPLMGAAESGNVQAVLVLLNAGADPDITDKNGDSPLHIAARLGWDEVVQLLAPKTQLDMPNKDAETPLVAAMNMDNRGSVVAILRSHKAEPLLQVHWAVAHGNEQLMRKLMLGQAGSNLRDGSGRTPLHHAAEHGHLEIAKALLEANADADTQTLGTGRTALHLAAWRGDENMVALLLLFGSDICCLTSAQRTALHEAIAPGKSYACLLHLLKSVQSLPRGPDAPSANSTGRRIVDGIHGFQALPGASLVGGAARGTTTVGLTMSEDVPALIGKEKESECSKPRSQLGIINAQDDLGYTALMLAARMGLDNEVKLLLEAGADIHRSDLQGWKAISCAAENGHLKVVQTLIAAGAPRECRGAEDRTPLHMAAGNGHLEVCKYLISIKATVDVLNSVSSTPLMYAAASGHVEVMRYLINQGANINRTDSRGATAIIYLAKSMPENAIDALNLLIEAGADVNKQDVSSKAHALIAAVEVVQPTVNLSQVVPDFLRILIKAGANLAVRDQVGMTAIMHAAQAGHAESVCVLLEAGADPNEVCDNGSASLEYAQWRVSGNSHKHMEVIKILLEDKLLLPGEKRKFEFEAVDLNQCDWEDESPLSYAANYNQVEVAKLLLSLGADKMNMANTGFLPVHAAAQHGSLEVMRLLLQEHGMEKLLPSKSGRTLIHIASGFGHADVLHFLIHEMNMDANQPSYAQRGQPPLDVWQTYPPPSACKNIVVKVSDLLLKSEAVTRSVKKNASDVMALIENEGVRVCCPLRTDRMLVYFEIKILEGANPACLDVGMGKDMLEYFMRPGHSEDTFGYAGESGLAWTGGEASIEKFGPRFGKGDTVGVVWNRSIGSCSMTLNGRYLGIISRSVLKDSCSAMVCLRSGGIQIHANFGQEPFKFNMDDLMVEEEGRHNPGNREPWPFKKGMFPLHMAACSKNISVLNMLLESGAMVDTVDADGWSSLHFATLNNWDEGIKVLLDRGADKCRVTAHGSTALLFAVKYSATAAARMLLEANAPCDVRDLEQRTLLMWAASSGNIEIMQLLIERGVGVKAKDVYGRTAVQYACNEAVVSYLENILNQKLIYREVFEINLLEEVKLGGEGLVVMAKHVTSGNKLAIKYHRHADARDKSASVMCRLGEQYVARLARGLQSSQVIFDDPKTYPDHPYAMVMEGGEDDLHEIIELMGGLGLPHNQCRYIFETMAAAVQQMHLLDLVHHDLKPKNFVRWFDGRFRLIDFDSTRMARAQDMGQTTLEICAPEMAGALLRRERLSSHPSMDIWALGCCLYQMVTTRLFINQVLALMKGKAVDIYALSQEDGMRSIAELTQPLVDQVIDNLASSGTSVKLQKQASSILRLMLQVDPQRRATIEAVLMHTFLTGGNTLAMDEEMMGNMQRSLQHVHEVVDQVLIHTLAISDRTLALADLPNQIQSGFREVQNRLKGLSSILLQVAGATTCPSMYVITPDITPKQVVLMMQRSGASIINEICNSWTSDLEEVIKCKLSLPQLVRKLATRQYRLYLLCGKCLTPQGNGYVIEKSTEWLAKMLPGLKLTLTVAKIYNVAASIGRLFFPVLPVIPASMMDKATKLLNEIKGDGSSAEDFAVIHEGTLQADASSDNELLPQNQVGGSLRQLHQFLMHVDPSRTWGGLVMVDMDGDAEKARGTSKEGHNCMWVCSSCMLDVKDVNMAGKNSLKQFPPDDSHSGGDESEHVGEECVERASRSSSFLCFGNKGSRVHPK